MTRTPEKKSERMEVRLGHQEKQAFVDACDLQGDTPSGAVRRFISGYTKRADGDVMGEANRRLMRRYGVGAGVFAGICAAFLVAGTVWPLGSEPSRFMTQGEFAALDLDGNGSLTADELGPRADDLLRVLDIDGTPGVQFAEAISEGRMAYMLGSSVEVVRTDTGGALEWSEGKPPTRLVEFDLDLPYKAAVFETVGNDYSMAPERTVIWETGKTEPTLVIGKTLSRR